MPKEVLEINDFNNGTSTTPSERDIAEDSAAYSLNIDPISEDGKLKGIKQDRLVLNLSDAVTSGSQRVYSLDYGTPWNSNTIRVNDLLLLPPPNTTGNGSRIFAQGTRGINEILKYTGAAFESSSFRNSTLDS